MAQIEKQEIERLSNELLEHFVSETTRLTAMLTCVVNALDRHFGPVVTEVTTYHVIECIKARLVELGIPYAHFMACVKAHGIANKTIDYLRSLPDD